MKAIGIERPGGPEVMHVVDLPSPEPAPGEVLIEVDAAGVNRPDLMQRQGKYPPPPGASAILGLEVAGHVTALGLPDEWGSPRSASGHVWRIGDAVTALVAGGGYAELCAAPGVQCLPVPRGMSVGDAAAMPETFFTVWTNVFERGRLQAGEWLLVHGGTSGIGTTAIQLATARGARVIATAGTTAKCLAAERIGASHVINYRTDDFVAAVKDLTGGAGVNVVLDMVGGDYVARNIACLTREGRLVQIAHMSGPTATIPLRPIMTERLTMTGSTLRPRSPAEKGAIAAALEREVWPLVEAGRVRPIVDAVYPLEETPQAHARLEGGDVIGKLVLNVKG